MLRLLRFSVDHPWQMLLLVAAVSVAACVFAPRVRLQLDARALIPVNDPSLASSDQAARYFGLKDMIAVGVVNEEAGVYTKETLERIDRLGRKLARVEGVVAGSITSLATVPRMFIEGREIDTRPLLSQAESVDAETVERVRRETELMGLNNGLLVAADGKAAAIFAEVEEDADRYSLLQQMRVIVEGESDGGDTIHLSGTALAQAAVGHSAASDLARLGPAVVIVLAIVLILTFGHPLPAFVSLLEVGVSLLWTCGLMGFTGQSVFITTLILPVILIVIGVSDDVYALNEYFTESRDASDASARTTALNALGRAKNSIMLTSGTTIVGLLSLTITPLEHSRVLGVYGAIAIAFSALMTFTLVPAVLVLFHPRVMPKRFRMTRFGAREAVARTGSFVRANPRRVVASVLGVALCSLMLATTVRVDDAWVNNLPASSDIYRGDRFLNDLLAGTTALELMVDSGREEGFLAPETLSALGEIEDATTGLGYVGAANGIYGDVVRLNASLKGLAYREYREALKEGRAALTREEIEQSLLLIASARPLTAGDRLDGASRRSRLTVLIRHADYRRIDEVLKTAAGASLKAFGSPERVVAFGGGWISYLTVHLLVSGQMYSLAGAILADLLLLSLMFWSVRSALLTIAPVVFSLLVVFAVLGLANLPIGIANSMFAGLACGIGLDFSIHLSSVYQRNRALGLTDVDSVIRALVHTGPAIITSAVATVAGLSVLMLSEVAPNVQLGLMLCVSLFVCSASTLLILPGVVLWKRIRNDHQEPPVLTSFIDGTPARFGEYFVLWARARLGASAVQRNSGD
ncbi:MAG TPA: MMPL family transporter [Blastocatellia bacterium]|nr:MMPL family transporter [Blastocatellia bacterium]